MRLLCLKIKSNEYPKMSAIVSGEEGIFCNIGTWMSGAVDSMFSYSSCGQFHKTFLGVIYAAIA